MKNVSPEEMLNPNGVLLKENTNNLIDDFHNLTKTIGEYKRLISGKQIDNELSGKLCVTLDQVTRDMADILSNLRTHISATVPSAVKESISTQKIEIQKKIFFKPKCPKNITAQKNSFNNNNNQQVKKNNENTNQNNQNTNAKKLEKIPNKKEISVIKNATTQNIADPSGGKQRQKALSCNNSPMSKIRFSKSKSVDVKVEDLQRQLIGISRKVSVNNTIVKQPYTVNLKKMQGEDKTHLTSPPSTPITAIHIKGNKLTIDKRNGPKYTQPEPPRVRNSKLGKAIVNKRFESKSFSGILNYSKRPSSNPSSTMKRFSSNTSSNAQPNNNSHLGLFSFNQRQHSDLTKRIAKDSLSQSYVPNKFRTKQLLRKSLSAEIDPFIQLKRELDRAVMEHKTFTLKGQYACIRKALLKRGWVEKFHITTKDPNVKKFQIYSTSDLVHFLRIKDIAPHCKKVLMSKLLEDHQVDLFWSFSYDGYRETCDKKKLTLLSKFRKDVFNYTSKQGLAEIADNAYWFHIPGVSQINHPRSYKLNVKKNYTESFINDFHITAAMSLLKWVIKSNSTREIKLISPCGKIPIQTFDFAVNECYKFIKHAQHCDIDETIEEASTEEWDKFLDYYYNLVHIGNHFKKEGKVTSAQLVKKAGGILNCLKTYWPYLDMDGHLNIWIMKPNLGSCGFGIHICRTLQYILKTVKHHANIKYVVQKYIERPLLIHNTKFDIRQWFLISSSVPLTIWMYKVCYLRFSSQTYNLRKLHNSIHLTNNAVQSKYKSPGFDMSLPAYNMWDLTEFQNYLTCIGYPDVWKNIIYPGMKQGITAAVLIYQDKIDKRPNCFELYGADFMLTEDFTPWLIEINSSPALYASTPVTGKLCPEVLEDVVKVVVDHAQNKEAGTGKFELIYEEKPAMNICKFDADLKVEGIPLSPKYFDESPIENGKQEPVFLPYDVEQYAEVQSQLKSLGDEVKDTLENLLQVIQSQNN